MSPNKKAAELFVKFSNTANGSRLGEVGDFENETLKLLLNLN